MSTPTKILTAVFLTMGVTLMAQTTDSTKIKASYHEVNFFVEDNEACFRCHGENKYTLEDAEGEKAVTKRMGNSMIVDRDMFYTSVHKSFSCTDCHSYDFMEFPHSLESRFEENLMCMDCHGYDETYAQYHFEGIEEEFANSAHNREGFNCWSCHDPHAYKAFMRNADDLEEAILYDNNMCLRCHADFDEFSMLTERAEIILVESHDWLPNQAAHFANMRCIECHTEINDSIFIAHQILPKENAVKKCTECHSRDSRLMHTLYKFESAESRKGGFVNSIIVKNSYVIGANQNVWLNRLSLLVFGATLLVIGFHIYLRIRQQKNS